MRVSLKQYMAFDGFSEIVHRCHQTYNQRDIRR